MAESRQVTSNVNKNPPNARKSVGNVARRYCIHDTGNSCEYSMSNICPTMGHRYKEVYRLGRRTRQRQRQRQVPFRRALAHCRRQKCTHAGLKCNVHPLLPFTVAALVCSSQIMYGNHSAEYAGAVNNRHRTRSHQ